VDVRTLLTRECIAGVTTPNVKNRTLRNSDYRIEAQKVRSFLGGETVLPLCNRGVSQVHGDQVLRNTVLSGGGVMNWEAV